VSRKNSLWFTAGARQALAIKHGGGDGDAGFRRSTGAQEAARMRRVALVFAVLLLSGAWFGSTPGSGPPSSFGSKRAQAPQAEPKLPTAHEVFDHYTEAIGGRAAWEKLNTRVSRGTVRVQGMDGTGTILVYERAPNLQLSTLTLPNGLVLREGFDGKGGWEQDSEGKVKGLEGARASDVRAEADFYFEVSLEKMFPRAKLIGQRTADGRMAYVIEASVPGGTQRWLYFDAESWLRFRTDVFENPLSPSPTSVLRYDDYRDVDGIKYPYRGSVEGSGVNISFRFTVLRHNVTVADDQLIRPASESN
jgi:zinc protease